MMTITKKQLIRLIKEELARLVVDEVHVAPDGLEDMNPYEAYGLGYEAGVEHVDIDEDIDNSIDEFVDGSYGMRGRTVPMGVPGRK